MSNFFENQDRIEVSMIFADLEDPWENEQIFLKDFNILQVDETKGSYQKEQKNFESLFSMSQNFEIQLPESGSASNSRVETLIQAQIGSSAKQKKRNNQNSNRGILRKLEKMFGKIFGKTYKIHFYNQRDRRQILAILRSALLKSIDDFHIILTDLEIKYEQILTALRVGDLNLKHKDYKTVKLVEFLIKLTPEDLDEYNLQSTLANLWKIGQVKNHPMNADWKVESYLQYEKNIKKCLLG